MYTSENLLMILTCIGFAAVLQNVNIRWYENAYMNVKFLKRRQKERNVFLLPSLRHLSQGFPAGSLVSIREYFRMQNLCQNFLGVYQPWSWTVEV